MEISEFGKKWKSQKFKKKYGNLKIWKKMEISKLEKKNMEISKFTKKQFNELIFHLFFF